MIDIYNQIVKLKADTSREKQKKGYLFEQLVREIQPWDFRPPIVAIGLSEQMDGVYNWDGKTFIIECKAKENAITRGDHDWEDFELKIRKRKGNVIGLYCSLNVISPAIYEAASDMNKDGCTTIVLSDDFWPSLAEEKLEFGIILNYLILYARINFKAAPPDVKKIKEWYYDCTDILKKIHSILINESSTFLRRYKKEHHARLYVDREIDRNIHDFSRQLKPSALRPKKKTREINGVDTTYDQPKDFPIQIFMLRDLSGAGKTFFSTQYAEYRDSFLSFTKAANQKDIDNLPDVMKKISVDFGIQELIALDKPLLYFIDSLDEAIYSFNKRVEVRSLIQSVTDVLNPIGRRFDLSSFPIGIVFTIREDYWHSWESEFEGRRLITNRKVISMFNEREFNTALKNYSDVFQYEITNKLDDSSLKVLAVPVNLAIFSETNEYKGDIEVEEIWEENVLYSYFLRKKDNIIRRGIPGISQELCMRVCASITYVVIKKKLNQVHRKDILELIRTEYKIIEPIFDELLLLLESESILTSSPEDQLLYSFRHNRFIEFLSAYYILFQLDKDRSIETLDTFSEQVFESGLASMFKVHDFIIYISKKEFPDIANNVANYYANSESFMEKNLRKIRFDISMGEPSNQKILNLILKKTSSKNPDITWNSFFVVVAKQNHPRPKDILSTFKTAWDTNLLRNEIWKLLPKMADNGLLMYPEVLSRIISSDNARIWEVFLGLILEYSLHEEFKAMWKELDNEMVQCKMSGKEWDHDLLLIDVLVNGKKFTLGGEFKY